MDASKFIMWVAITVGGGVGTYMPVLFGADPLGGMSILFGTIGSIAGIWIWYKFLRV